MFCPLKYFNVCSLLISSHKPTVFLLEKVAFMAVNSLIPTIDPIVIIKQRVRSEFCLCPLQS